LSGLTAAAKAGRPGRDLWLLSGGTESNVKGLLDDEVVEPKRRAGRGGAGPANTETAGTAIYIVADLAGARADRCYQNVGGRIVVLRKVDRYKATDGGAVAGIDGDGPGAVGTTNTAGTATAQRTAVGARRTAAADNDVMC